MRRVAAAALSLALLGLCAGCSIVGATAGAVTSVTAATVATAGKVTVATVKTTGRVAGAAMTSSGEVTAGGLEAAAKLSRAGMVVVVDAGTGAITELPWQEGMRLAAAVEAAKVSGPARALKIYRQGQITRLDRLQSAPQLALLAGDVIELAR